MDQIYEEGYGAFGKAVSQQDNPYASDAQKQARWNEGWEDAKIDFESKRGHPCYEDRSGRL